MKTDWLIVGAGFTGSVLAERIASQLGQKVLVVESRNHIGGNAYDYHDEHGILVHRYGPHIFHTNDEGIWSYLSRFTRWRPYYHRVLAMVDGHAVPVPFNFNSIAALFPPERARQLERLLLERFDYGSKTPILQLREAEDPALRELADFIYDKVFLGYTVKQWEMKPEELAPSVTARIPFHLSRDDRYFQDRYQGLPQEGYTRLFERLLDHPNIRLMLNTDYHDVVEEIEFERMIYTGPVDVFFDFIHGELPYRSLRFEMQHHAVEQYQSVAQMNYPNEYPWTRISEFKHLTGQSAPGTTVAVEYPQPFVRGKNDPYYPIPCEANAQLFRRYQKEIDDVAPKILFAGRLADYRYYNMDQAVGRALALFRRISEGR